MGLRGNIEHADRNVVQGWARDEDNPDAPVSVVVTVNGQLVSQLVANIYREDLAKAGMGDGRHGFLLNLANLSPALLHIVRVTLLRDGEDVPGSPAVIPPSLHFDAEMQVYLAKMLPDAESDEDLTARVSFLAQQVDRLLQVRAERYSNRSDCADHRQFRTRWTGRNGAVEPEHLPRALVIDDVTPDINRDAGSQAVISHMRSLQRLGYVIVFAPANMDSGSGLVALKTLGIACCHAPWCGSVEEVLRREVGGFNLIYLHRGGNARYLPLIRHHQPRARVVYSVASLQHLRLARQGEAEQRPAMLEDSQRVRADEMFAAHSADSVITHSSVEASVIKFCLPDAKVHVVPWSVQPHPTQVPWAERCNVAFIGNYDYYPNLDAALWLIQEVMPLVWVMDSSIECSIVGSNMPDTLKSAVAPGIHTVGWIEDLPRLFDTVRLTVAPIAFGAGVPGKVLESMAAGIPCACTPFAVEGLNLPEVLTQTVAQNAAGLAAIILRLHSDEAFNDQCSKASLAFVMNELSEDRLDVLMRDAIGSGPV